MSKNLVVFYSRKGENHMPGGIQVLEKGHAHFAAEFIANAVDADIFDFSFPNGASLAGLIMLYSTMGGMPCQCGIFGGLV